MQQRHYECDIGRTDQQELDPSQDKYIMTRLRNATKIIRVDTLTRSECIIVIIYGWYQSFILISW